jgi:hypothetical protein
MSDQEYIAERMARFQDAYNRLDIEDSMSFYAEEADHCDYGPCQSLITLITRFYKDHYCPFGFKRLTNAALILTGNLSVHMDKNTIRAFFANSFKVCGDINITTAAISGTKELSVWEWNMTFTSIGLMPGDDGNGGWANKVSIFQVWLPALYSSRSTSLWLA